MISARIARHSRPRLFLLRMSVAFWNLIMNSSLCVAINFNVLLNALVKYENLKHRHFWFGKEWHRIALQRKTKCFYWQPAVAPGPSLKSKLASSSRVSGQKKLCASPARREVTRHRQSRDARVKVWKPTSQSGRWNVDSVLSFDSLLRFGLGSNPTTCHVTRHSTHSAVISDVCFIFVNFFYL